MPSGEYDGAVSYAVSRVRFVTACDARSRDQTSKLPLDVPEKTTLFPSGEKLGAISWSIPGKGVSSTSFPETTFQSARFRPRSRRTKAAMKFPSGDTAAARPGWSLLIVTACAIRYS